MKVLAREFPQGVAYSIPFDTTIFVRQADIGGLQNSDRSRPSWF